MKPTHPVAHVAWSCDGRKLASVGTDKAVRVWSPEKTVWVLVLCTRLSSKTAPLYSLKVAMPKDITEDTTTIQTTSHGTNLTPNYFVLQVNEIEK